MEVSVLTKRKAALNVCSDPSCSVRRALCPHRGWGHHWPHSCLSRGSAVGSPLLLLLPGPLEKPLTLGNTSASRPWLHEHGPCQWKLIPMEPCGTMILDVVWPETELFASLLSSDFQNLLTPVLLSKQQSDQFFWHLIFNYPSFLISDIKIFLIYGSKSLIALKYCDNSSL